MSPVRRKKTLAFILAFVLLAACFPVGAALADGEAVYDPELAIAYADKHWKESKNDYNVSGKGATFVRKCLAAGGVKWTKSPSTVGDLTEYLVDNGYATAYQDAQLDIQGIVAGDLVGVYCKNHKTLWGLQVFLVSEGYTVETDGIKVDSKNNARHDYLLTTKNFYSLDDNIKCDSCNSKEDHYIIHLSMNAKTKEEPQPAENGGAAGQDAPGVLPENGSAGRDAEDDLPSGGRESSGICSDISIICKGGWEDKGKSCKISDYPEFELALEDYYGECTEPGWLICGVLVDLSHDGEPELLLVRIRDRDLNSGETNRYPIDMRVCMLVNGRYKIVYTDCIGTGTGEKHDLFLTCYNGLWYLTERYYYIHQGLWGDSFNLLYFASDGSVVYKMQNPGLVGTIDGEENPFQPSQSEYDSYYELLSLLLSRSIMAACGETYFGSDIDVLILVEIGPEPPTDNGTVGKKQPGAAWKPGAEYAGLRIKYYTKGINGKEYSITDYPDYGSLIENYCKQNAALGGTIYGVLVDLSHDGEPELLLVRINEDLDYYDPNNLYFMQADVYMMVSGSAVNVYSYGVGTGDGERQDTHLVYYEGGWYLLERYYGAKTGQWFDSYRVWYFDDNGKLIYLYDDPGLSGTIEGEEEPFQPTQEESDRYYRLLDLLLKYSLKVMCCAKYTGTDLGVLLVCPEVSEQKPTSPQPETPAVPFDYDGEILEATEVSSSKGYKKFDPFCIGASSELTAEGVFFSVDRLFDGDVKTTWQEASPTTGSGEWVSVTYGGAVILDLLYIRPGYAKSEGGYLRNCRPKSMLVTMVGEEGKAVYRLNFTDENRDFYFRLDKHGDIKPDSITFTIEDVYLGDTYTDLALSEIGLYSK